MHARAAAHDSNRSDEDRQHAAVMRLLARVNSLVYLILPLGVFATKAQEAMNEAVVFAKPAIPYTWRYDLCPCVPTCCARRRRTALNVCCCCHSVDTSLDHAGVSFTTPLHRRAVRWMLSVARYVATVGMVFNRGGPIFVYAILITTGADTLYSFLMDTPRVVSDVKAIQKFGNLAPL